MAEHLPIKIIGRFAHFYPESLIEIPDDFWAKLRRELYPPHLFRPENAINLHFEGKMDTVPGTGSKNLITLNDKEVVLIYFIWFSATTMQDDNLFYIYLNGRMFEQYNSKRWKLAAPQATNANIVHWLLKPKDVLDIYHYNGSAALETVQYIARAYKWIET